jgi:hypothetical protein
MILPTDENATLPLYPGEQALDQIPVAHRPTARQPARQAQTGLQQQDRFDAFVHEFNTGRPHEALGMKRPVELYTASPRRYDGLGT